MVNVPTAYVVCGNAGVGKSTFGRALARQHQAALVDIDTCTERLARVALRASGLLEDDRDSPAYKALLREPVYEALFDIAAENLLAVSCVIVGPFTAEKRRVDWPLRLEQRLGAPVQIIHVLCEETVRRARIVARGNPRDAGKLAAWADYAALGVEEGPLPFAHSRIDTTAT